MTIHFWKTTHFWAKTSLPFIVRGPNSVHSEVFRCDDPNGTSFKAVWWSVSKKNTFWAKTSLSFIVRGPNSVHSEVFRSDDHNGTSFKAVWWSISEKNTFWPKTSLFIVFSVAKFSLPWGFQVWWSQWYRFQSCMMNHFWKKSYFEPKASLFFVFSGPNSVHSEVFRCDDHNGTSFKAVWWSVSEKTHILG